MKVRKAKIAKRAQLTTFIIIAIIVVVLFMVGFFLYQQSSIAQFNKNSRVIRDFYVGCLSNHLGDGLSLLARQGGYYKINPAVLATFLGERTAFYFINGHLVVPSVDNVSDELSNYLNDNECNLSMQMPDTKVKLKCDKPRLLMNKTTVDCKLNVVNGKYHKMFDLEIYGPALLRQLNASSDIVNNYSEKPGYACIECLDEIASKHKVNISIVPVTTSVNASRDMAWFFVKPLNESNLNENLNKSLTLRFAVTLR